MRYDNIPVLAMGIRQCVDLPTTFLLIDGRHSIRSRLMGWRVYYTTGHSVYCCVGCCWNMVRLFCALYTLPAFADMRTFTDYAPPHTLYCVAHVDYSFVYDRHLMTFVTA